MPDKHSLRAFVLDLYANGPSRHHDRVTVACALSGCTSFIGKDARRANRAYLTVAEDVLGCMKREGDLVQDRQGWFVPAAPQQETP